MFRIRDWLPSIREYSQERLFSLDLLRGLDMFLLTVVGPLVAAAQASWKCFPGSFYRQFHHAWEGFVLWDVIMPLFIFMCGAAMPFALRKRLQEGMKAFWRHVLGRVALLWFLGGLVQGHWAEFVCDGDWVGLRVGDVDGIGGLMAEKMVKYTENG